MNRAAIFAMIVFVCCGQLQRANAAGQPNVLFISVDDLNDWIGCLGGHPQAKTPNIDRLAARGMLFNNAHCPAPACNPSRTAIMTGISPHKSGLYDNRQKMRELLPDAELLPKFFSRHGYWSAGSGKILHYFIDAPSWDEYYPPKETEDPFPRTLYPESRPVSLPRGGPWQYIETDWAALDATDEEFGGDWLVSKWIGEQLRKQHEQPFFLACGIYRPHEPWFVPKKYFDLFPLEEIQLPPGYKEDDLADLPPAGKRRGPNRYFAHIRKHQQWKQAIQGYLASIAFADAMVGRVLKALDEGPHRDNTIVALWSDHGWHLGEKQHWQKFTAWRACTRVPLIMQVPAGCPGLPQGTQAGSRSDAPVNLLSLYPTLVQLCGLPNPETQDGPSLVPLLANSSANWPHVSLTFLNKPGNYGLSDRRWRYIEYDNGDRELYDTLTDRYEWTNLADVPQHASRIERLRAHAPRTFASYKPPSDASLPELTWHPADTADTPASRPDGNRFDVVFINQRGVPVKVFWLTPTGQRKSYGTLEAGWRKPQSTRPGAVWLISDLDDEPLGYFQVGDRGAKAIIPAPRRDAKKRTPKDDASSLLHPDALPNRHAAGDVDKPELVRFIVDDVAELPGIVVDELTASLVGTWQYSTHTPPYVGAGYLHDQKSGKGTKSATFTPELPHAGEYEVRLSHCYNVRRATNTPVRIHHAEGDTTIRINQQETPPHNRLFRSLGTFRFHAGKEGWLRISTDGTQGKYVIVDAVQFIPIR